VDSWKEGGDTMQFKWTVTMTMNEIVFTNCGGTSFAWDLVGLKKEKPLQLSGGIAHLLTLDLNDKKMALENLLDMAERIKEVP
jgi:hypothetical protein